MKLDKFTGEGSTDARRRFWNNVADTLITLQKREGKNVSVREDPTGSLISVNPQRQGTQAPTGACCIGTACSITTEAACAVAGGTYQGDGTPCSPNPCSTPDCSSCSDLPTTNPSGPPIHINIVRSLSGTCGAGTVGGSQTYDFDLDFALEGPIGGHVFCAHNVFDNGFGAFWTGAFTCNGSSFYTQGFSGLLGRDVTDCSWWFNLGTFLPTSCGGCSLAFASIFEMITGPGDPSGVYTFTETVSGLTMTTVVTIT